MSAFITGLETGSHIATNCEFFSFPCVFVEIPGNLKTDIFPDSGVIEEINVAILLNFIRRSADLYHFAHIRHLIRLTFSLAAVFPPL